jgi:signal transduction histidine kinase
MLDAETGSRGYLLTGDPRYLEPYNAAVASIGEQLDTLHKQYAQSTDEAATLAQLTRNVQRKLAEMELSVRMRKQGNDDAWKFILMTDLGKEQMDAIRADAVKLIDGSAHKMEASDAQVRRSLQWSRFGIAAVTLAGLLAFYLYLRQSNALKTAGEKQQRALEQERDLLERQVRERTASLAELATHLQNVREEERGHLARELHDELGALLTAAKLDVARLKSRLGPQAGPEIAERLQHLTESLNSGIALKRRIIEDLRPSSLSNLGLSASLEILAREFSERAGIEVTTELEPVDLDESRQLTVYRLVQESLTNVGKYAEARQVEISLRNYGGHVEVDIKDDGKGFDATRMRPSTHGLAGMRHRVEAAGGKLTVASMAGKGTRIAAVLPATVGAPAAVTAD